MKEQGEILAVQSNEDEQNTMHELPRVMMITDGYDGYPQAGQLDSNPMDPTDDALAAISQNAKIVSGNIE